MLKSKQPLFIVFVLAALIGFGLAGYFFYQYQAVKNNPEASKKAAQEEAKKLATEIGRFILLPADEIPELATVSDVKQLKNQPFFKTAKNGDKVLLYPKSQKAILYDPEIRKVKEIGPINANTQQTQPSQAKIALRNGTAKNGLASVVEGEIQKAFPGSNIVGKGEAKKKNYDKTVVVAFSPDSKQAAETLAKFLSVSLSSLPDGEVKPDGADILVIVGEDRQKSENTTTPTPTNRLQNPTN